MSVEEFLEQVALPGDAILPPRVLDRRLQEAWARATKEGPRVLMNLRVDF